MLKISQRVCSVILSLALLFTLTTTAYAANPTTYDLSNGPITLTATTGDIIVTGSYNGHGAAISVQEGYTGTITLDNVNINAKRVAPSVPVTGIYGQTSYTNKGPEEYSAIFTEIYTNVTLNVVGECKIYAEHIGIYGTIESPLLLTGTGNLEIEAIEGYCITGEDIIIDAKCMLNGPSRAKNLTINKKTDITSKTTGIEVTNITINAETNVTGRNHGIFVNNSIVINADTTAVGKNGYGVYSQTDVVVSGGSLSGTANTKIIK